MVNLNLGVVKEISMLTMVFMSIPVSVLNVVKYTLVETVDLQRS